MGETRLAPRLAPEDGRGESVGWVRARDIRPVVSDGSFVRVALASRGRLPSSDGRVVWARRCLLLSAWRPPVALLSWQGRRNLSCVPGRRRLIATARGVTRARMACMRAATHILDLRTRGARV